MMPMSSSPFTPAIDDQGQTVFFAKAEAREPILGAALGFVPEGSRSTFQAWIGLLAELRECVFELSDSRVTALKIGWWVEELEGVRRGAARHPLTRVLIRHGGPWSAVTPVLAAVAADHDPPPDFEHAVADLRPLADALLAVERHLFGLDDKTIEIQSRALVLGWLRHRLERGLEAADRARVPLALFARHGLRREQLALQEADALRRDWAGCLLAALPAVQETEGWAYPRRLSLQADRRALAALAVARPQGTGRGGAFLLVYNAWRLARRAALRVPDVLTTTT